jgi:hypothetical protein
MKYSTRKKNRQDISDWIHESGNEVEKWQQEHWRGCSMNLSYSNVGYCARTSRGWLRKDTEEFSRHHTRNFTTCCRLSDQIGKTDCTYLGEKFEVLTAVAYQRFGGQRCMSIQGRIACHKMHGAATQKNTYLTYSLSRRRIVGCLPVIM